MDSSIKARVEAVANASSSQVQPPILALLEDSSRSVLIKQGAEAKVYKSSFSFDRPSYVTSLEDGDGVPSASGSSTAASADPSNAVLLKYRFPKHYRHPTLSTQITAHRTAMEARALMRCAKAGITVPGIRCVDERTGVLGIEWVEGKSVREWLGGGAEGEEDYETDEEEQLDDIEDDEEVLSEEDQLLLMDLVGAEIAHMHSINVVHGDLTTSNMMLRRADTARRRQKKDHTGTPQSVADAISSLSLDGNDSLVLIDFGLASVSSLAEDKAVDLYVLERAFASTHPSSEHLFQRILEKYFSELKRRTKGEKVPKGGVSHVEDVRKKLNEVRMRGRKRSMVG